MWEKSVNTEWHDLDYLVRDENTKHLLLQKNHQYYFQMQSQMAVSGCGQTCFLVW